MCGLAGLSINQTPAKSERKQLSDLVRTMCVAAAKRGVDSWGFGIVDSKEVLYSARGLGSIEKVMDAIPLFGRSLMLHTRHGTVGEATIANAHPFSLEGILGAHNGVVQNHRSLETLDKRRYPVDSMALLARIGKGENASDVQAWGAVSWIDEGSPGEGVRLARLPSGSLQVFSATLAEGSQLAVWISDAPKDMLKGLDDTKEFEISGQHVYLVTKGKVYVTERRLAVGSKPWYSYFYSSSYETKEYKKGKNGEVYLSAEPCTCEHTFGRHSVWSMYGGICLERTCACKVFMPVRGEEANQAKRALPTEKRLQESCACTHPRSKHKRNKGICWEKVCRCKKFTEPSTTPSAPETKIEITPSGGMPSALGHEYSSPTCDCGHVRFGHQDYQSVTSQGVTRITACMRLGCDCEMFTAKSAEKVAKASSTEEVTEVTRKTFPSTPSPDSAKRTDPGTGVAATLEKLGKEAAEAHMARAGLTGPCKADICKLRGSCSPYSCPRRPTIHDTSPVSSGYHPGRERP